MLTLFTWEARMATPPPHTGYWYELAPGPDDGKYGPRDGAFFRPEQWEGVAEPVLADRLLGYDRHGRVCVGAEDWQEPLAHLEDLCARLKRVDEPAMLHVEASDLPLNLIRELDHGFPAARDELLRDLVALTSWCRATLRRWHAITVIGL